MSRVIIAAGLAVMMAVPVLLASAAADGTGSGTAGASGEGRRAVLMPASLDPLALRGTGFVRRERVRLSVSAGPGTVERRVRAGRRGSFRVSFPGVDTCNGVTADASGNRGSRASFQLSSLGC